MRVMKNLMKELASIEAFSKRVKATQEPMPWDTPPIYRPTPSYAADNKAENPYKLDAGASVNPLGWKGPYDNP